MRSGLGPNGTGVCGAVTSLTGNVALQVHGIEYLTERHG
jgi:hypothetical protein